MADSRLTINDLPLQILSQVLASLNFKQRQAASLVSKRWYEAAQDQQFLEQTLLKIKSTCRDWDRLEALEKRRIPNLEITFKKYGEISPEIAHRVKLASYVKHLTLRLAVNASSVSFCIRHFQNLQTITLSPGRFHWFSFFFDDDFGKKFYQSLPLSPKMTLVVPLKYESKELCRFLKDLSGVKYLTLKNKDRRYPRDSWPLPPLNGEFVVELFAREDRARNLQELDLSWMYMDIKSFKDLISIEHLQLRSLKYRSTQQGREKLVALGESSLPLESLGVVCEKTDCFDVGIPVLQSLLAMKPSFKSLRVAKLSLRRDIDISNGLADIFSQCPDITKLHIKSKFTWRNADTDLKFSVTSGKHGRSTTLVIQPNADIDANIFEHLAKHSPGLKVLLVESVSGMSGEFLSMIMRSFSDLEQLEVSGLNLKDVDLSSLCSKAGSDGRCVSKLRVLHIKDCKYLTDKSLSGLSLPCLEHLRVEHAKNITDRAVTELVSSHPSLRLLSLARCSGITDKSVKAVSKHLKHLQCLVLKGCEGITSRAARDLTRCHHLQYLETMLCEESFQRTMHGLHSSMLFLQCLGRSVGDDKALEMGEETEWAFASSYYRYTKDICNDDIWDQF